MFEEQLKHLPAKPPRDLKLLPGLHLKAALPYRSAILILILPIGIFALFGSILINTPSWRLQVGNTRTAQAHVVSVADSRACKDVSHRLTYAFSAGGTPETRGATNVCSSSPYYSLQAGDTVAVKYLASDPYINRIAGLPDNDAPPLGFMLILPFVFLVAMSGIVVPQLRQQRFARRLFKDGTLALGTVIFVRRNARYGNYNRISTDAHVYIRYPLPTGGQQEARVRCDNDWLLQLLTPGSTVHIAYSETKPSEVALLEAFIR